MVFPLAETISGERKSDTDTEALPESVYLFATSEVLESSESLRVMFSANTARRRYIFSVDRGSLFWISPYLIVRWDLIVYPQPLQNYAIYWFWHFRGYIQPQIRWVRLVTACLGEVHAFDFWAQSKACRNQYLWLQRLLMILFRRGKNLGSFEFFSTFWWQSYVWNAEDDNVTSQSSSKISELYSLQTDNI